MPLPMISFYANQIGVVVPFIVLSAGPTADVAGTPMNLTSTTITWLCTDGSARPLTIVSALSATVQYITSAADFPRPTVLQAQLRVSGPTGTRFYSQQFAVHAVLPIEQRQ